MKYAIKLYFVLYYIQVTASTSAGSGPPAISDVVVVPEASEF